MSDAPMTNPVNISDERLQALIDKQRAGIRAFHHQGGDTLDGLAALEELKRLRLAATASEQQAKSWEVIANQRLGDLDAEVSAREILKTHIAEMGDYLEHHESCPWRTHPFIQSCTCGLDALMKKGIAR